MVFSDKWLTVAQVPTRSSVNVVLMVDCGTQALTEKTLQRRLGIRGGDPR